MKLYQIITLCQLVKIRNWLNKSSIREEFDALKSSLFAEVNSLKTKRLNSYPNDVFINNSERLKKTITRQN